MFDSMKPKGKELDPVKAKAMKDSLQELKRLAIELMGEHDPKLDLLNKLEEDLKGSADEGKVEMTVVTAKSDEPKEEDSEDELSEEDMQAAALDDEQEESPAEELKRKLLASKK